MKKKLLVFLLVAVLALGALGLNAFAGTEQTAATPVATALWTAENSVQVDGSLSETNWMFDSWIRGASSTPDGKFAKLWNGTDLYFAIETDGATSLKATLNETVINVSLGSSASADLEGVVVKQNGNVLEMKVPFASIGLAMHGYTQQMPMALELKNSAGTAKFDGKLTFNGQHVANGVVATDAYRVNTYAFHSSKYGYTQGANGGSYQGVDTDKNPTTGVSLRDALTLAQDSGQVGAIMKRTITDGGDALFNGDG